MPYTTDGSASRHARDRDVFSDGPRLGPYESPYDVRRGYEQPLRRVARREQREAQTVLFLGREEELDEGEREEQGL